MNPLRRSAFLAFVVAISPVVASAQDKPPAAAAAKPAEALTFDAVLVKPDESPKNVKIVDGIHCASAPPANFFKTPSPLDLADDAARKRMLENEALTKFVREFPKPKRSASQSFQADGGVAGSVLLFEYEADGVKTVKRYLDGYLWGKSKGPTATFPETTYVGAGVLVIVSFPQGDPAAEWFKSRLRKRFGVVAPPWSPELAKFMRDMDAAADRDDVDASLKILAENETLVASLAVAQFQRGEFAKSKHDYALAERSYRRAIELHESREDPLEPVVLWYAVDGLGGTLRHLNKLGDAETMLARAAALGRAGRFKDWSGSLYDLACAQALLMRYDAALASLKEAIDVDSKWKETAKTDDDFVEARKRPEFAKLLGL
jgi:tetratricopeptide (TPR) repeat protein